MHSKRKRVGNKGTDFIEEVETMEDKIILEPLLIRTMVVGKWTKQKTMNKMSTME